MLVMEIPIEKIVILENIRNEEPDADSVRELAEVMDANGQKVEIRVYSLGNGTYGLKVGHRRLAAAKLLQWGTIRAVIEDEPFDTEDLILEQFNENEQRHSLTYIERARVFLRLKNLGWSQSDISRATGYSNSDVSLSLAALRTPEVIQKAVNNGVLKPSAIEPILSLPEEDQEELADAVIAAKTVRNVKKLVDAHLKKKETFGKIDKKGSLSDMPTDADPLEQVVVDSLESALENLRYAEGGELSHPALVRRARPTVEELVRAAARLKKRLDGETWNDTADLV